VVTAVNGVTVKCNSELTREVAKGRPGDTLKLSVLRGGKPRTIDIKSGVRPTEKELALNDDDNSDDGAEAPAKPQVQKSDALGLTLAPIDDAARRTYSIDPSVRGLLIDGVKTSSDAGEKGLRKGDVLTSINGEPVASAAQVASAVDAAKKLQRPSR
jgi:serine protease Do